MSNILSFPKKETSQSSIDPEYILALEKSLIDRFPSYLYTLTEPELISWLEDSINNLEQEHIASIMYSKIYTEFLLLTVGKLANYLNAARFNKLLTSKTIMFTSGIWGCEEEFYPTTMLSFKIGDGFWLNVRHHVYDENITREKIIEMTKHFYDHKKLHSIELQSNTDSIEIVYVHPDVVENTIKEFYLDSLIHNGGWDIREGNDSQITLSHLEVLKSNIVQEWYFTIDKDIYDIKFV